MKKIILPRMTHRLFIKIRDYSKSIVKNERGQELIPVKWKEVKEANLGSIKIPNKDIYEVRFEPVFFEREEE